VRKRGADTCTDCFLFLNSFLGRRYKRNDITSDMDVSTSSSSSDSASSDEEDNELEEEIDNLTNKIREAKQHMK